MSSELIISTVLIVFILFMIMIFYIDIKLKRRKFARNENVKDIIYGYVLTPKDDDSNVAVLNGYLGLNEEKIIFCHQFQNQSTVLYLFRDEIINIVISDYLDLDNYEYSDINKYYIRNMAGLHITKKYPKVIKKTLLRIECQDNKEMMFFYNHSSENDKKIENVHSGLTKNLRTKTNT